MSITSRKARPRRAAINACCAGVMLIVGAALAAAQPSQTDAVNDEPLRPQFHFTAREHWLNDPNGLVFFQDEYHLFFQHNPLSNEGGDYKAWGNAVSTDLVHWRQLNEAIEPDELGSIWSGSAVVDWHDTAGLQTGGAPPIVAIYTAAGGKTPASAGHPFAQSLAASNDRGRNWVKYAANPVLGHVEGENRDPKVVWNQATKRWIMALYLADDRFGLFASPDLKEWKQLQEVRVPGSSECPDFFEIPIEGDSAATKWIFWSANNAYLVGTFDGEKFVDETGPQRCDFGDSYYAAQSFSDMPAADGRRIQMAWLRGGQFPGMPFNQQLSLPTSLTLRRFSEGLRLCRLPVEELHSLRDHHGMWSGTLHEDANPLADLAVDGCEIFATIDPAAARTVTLTVRGAPVTYDAASHRLATPKSACDVPLTDGKLRLHLYVDRTSIEIFADGGRACLAQCFLPPADDRRASLAGAGAVVESLDWWTLRSIWREAGGPAK